MDSTKFVLRTKTALSALLPIFAGGYLLVTGVQLDAETTEQVKQVIDQTEALVVGGLALAGGIGAIYGRLRANTQATLLPKT